MIRVQVNLSQSTANSGSVFFSTRVLQRGHGLVVCWILMTERASSSLASPVLWATSLQASYPSQVTPRWSCSRWVKQVSQRHDVQLNTLRSAPPSWKAPKPQPGRVQRMNSVTDSSHLIVHRWLKRSKLAGEQQRITSSVVSGIWQPVEGHCNRLLPLPLISSAIAKPKH